MIVSKIVFLANNSNNIINIQMHAYRYISDTIDFITDFDNYSVMMQPIQIT